MIDPTDDEQTVEILRLPGLRQLAREASAARGMYERKACNLADQVAASRAAIIRASRITQGLSPEMRSQLAALADTSKVLQVYRSRAHDARKAWIDAIDEQAREAADINDIDAHAELLGVRL